jgi:hypothetical protein
VKWFWIILGLVAACTLGLVWWNDADDAASISVAPPEEVGTYMAERAAVQPVEGPTPTSRPATAPAAQPGADVAPSPSLVTSIPGPAMLDQRFAVHGRGTDDDPYIVSWDLLMSAGEEYKPSEGKTTAPDRIMALQGAMVTINGYLAAPLLVQETDELLLMFNKWDGCCIGTPPTPFDAVEVKLQAPAKLVGQHMIRYGAVTGRFHIEPFLIGDMLISLYRLDEGKLEWSP